MKRFFKVAPAFLSLIAIVLWVIAASLNQTWWNFGLTAGAILAVYGIFKLVEALVTKQIMMQKARLFISVLLIIMAIPCIIFAISTPKNLIIPIVLLALGVLAFVIIAFSSHEKWDKAINDDPNYKTYFEREKEKKEKEEARSNTDTEADDSDSLDGAK